MKKYFSYKKEGMTFLFESFSNAIRHAQKQGMFDHAKDRDEFFSLMETLFTHKTEEEAKAEGKYEIAG